MMRACSGSDRCSILIRPSYVRAVNQALLAGPPSPRHNGRHTPPTAPRAENPLRPPVVLLGFLLLSLAAAVAPAQKDKDKQDDEKKFNSKTIAAWAKYLSSDDVG